MCGLKCVTHHLATSYELTSERFCVGKYLVDLKTSHYLNTETNTHTKKS